VGCIELPEQYSTRKHLAVGSYYLDIAARMGQIVGCNELFEQYSMRKDFAVESHYLDIAGRMGQSLEAVAQSDRYMDGFGVGSTQSARRYPTAAIVPLQQHQVWSQFFDCYTNC
jgi:hypothetical protein